MHIINLFVQAALQEFHLPLVYLPSSTITLPERDLIPSNVPRAHRYFGALDCKGVKTESCQVKAFVAFNLREGLERVSHHSNI